jgi:hypothetical protein
MVSDVVDDTETLGNTSAAVYEEAHFRAGVFAKLRQNMLDVFPIADASYADENWRERCDICLLESKIPVGWIEIRKAWFGTDQDWNAKPAEQFFALLWDVAKVAYQVKNQPDGCGYVAAFFYNQRHLPFASGVTETGSARHGCWLSRFSTALSHAVLRPHRFAMDHRLPWDFGAVQGKRAARVAFGDP